MGETHDAIDRFCRPRLSHHSVSTGNASCAGSRAGRHHHSSRLRMRTGHDTGCWCLHGKNHQAPSPQVYSLDRRRLRRVALLLRGSAVTARDVLQRCGPFHVRYWPSADSPIWPARFAFRGEADRTFCGANVRSRPKADYAYQKGARLINSRNAPIGI